MDVMAIIQNKLRIELAIKRLIEEYSKDWRKVVAVDIDVENPREVYVKLHLEEL